MPVYTLFLTNQDITGYPKDSEINLVQYAIPNNQYADSSTKTSATWNINFDKLFNNDNYKYRKCRVRVKMHAPFISTLATVFSGALGNICASLSTSYNEQTTIAPSLLSLGYVISTPTDLAYLDYPVNTMETSQGVNINMPTGSQWLTLIMGNNVNLTEMIEMFGRVWVNYLLTFELYDRILSE
jgi:hypothetical protein